MNTLDTIKSRRSICKYDSDASVPREHIIQMLEAAMMAPSACNTRPWEFVVVESKEVKEKIMKAMPYTRMLATAPLVIVLLLSVTLYGCSMNEENNALQAEFTEESGQEQNNVEDDGGTPAGETAIQNTPEVTAPTKEEVLAAGEQVLEGMSEEEAERLKENIKVANLQMESAYLNDNIFTKLESADHPYWQYFDEKGDIQVAWVYNGSAQEMKDIMEKENLSPDEFLPKYGTPVTVYNRFDAENFAALLEEMKETVQNEKLKDDLQKIIDETILAAETHDVEHAYNIYKLLHDMDYYLLRYGMEDVGKYVHDISTISKYYGVLSVYD